MLETKILYVEDELALAGIVKDTLESKGYEVCLVSDGAKVMEAIQADKPDICLLDVMLPNLDGFSIAKRMQLECPGLPIIFISAKNQTKDIIEGFKSGGNDYLKKPFSLEELLLRIENILTLKRGRKNNASAISLGKYLFDNQRLSLSIDGNVKTLTHRECEIIQKFSQHINGIVQKKNILLEIWGDDSIYNSRNLDVYINKLRDYFSQDPNIAIITLRGVGYRFNIDED